MIIPIWAAIVIDKIKRISLPIVCIRGEFCLGEDYVGKHNGAYREICSGVRLRQHVSVSCNVAQSDTHEAASDDGRRSNLRRMNGGNPSCGDGSRCG